MNEKMILSQINEFIAAKGYCCKDGLLEDLYLSLKSRPFVMITGRSDTDLSLLPRLFAQAVGANEENGRLKVLQVRPDWMDSSDLFGWLNLEGKFIPGVMIDFLKAAQEDPDKPYFLLLDGILLSRAEYYLRDVLNAIESASQEQGQLPLVTLPYYGRDEVAIEKYGQIPVLKNLFIIGTLNLDTASLPLNQRFLDRMHTVSVAPEDITGAGDGAVDSLELNSEFLETVYYRLEQCQHEAALLREYFGVLEQLNKILAEATAYIGFKVRNDMILYLMHNRLTGVMTPDQAMDRAICHKILPRVQGSEKMVKDVLCKLFAYCAGFVGELSAEEPVSEIMKRLCHDPNCQYPVSAGHIARMTAICEAEGFTSYWN